jgi:hypothetical protein
MVAVAAILAVAGTTLAASPHIVGSPRTTVDGNTLIVSVSVAGLGNVSTVTLSLEGELDVFSQCYNRGGKNPAADNKQESTTVDETGTFPVRNGRTNATFTVEPLGTLQCPGNQVAIVESATGTLDLIYEGESLGQIPVNYTR